MNIEKITKLFTQETGKDLASLIPSDGGDETHHVERFINKQLRIVTSYVRKFNIYFNYEKLKEKRQDLFNEILCYQLDYACENGDTTIVSGADFTTNQFVSDENLLNGLVAPFVKQLLDSYHFTYRGIY